MKNSTKILMILLLTLVWCMLAIFTIGDMIEAQDILSFAIFFGTPFISATLLLFLYLVEVKEEEKQ